MGNVRRSFIYFINNSKHLNKISLNLTLKNVSTSYLCCRNCAFYYEVLFPSRQTLLRELAKKNYSKNVKNPLELIAIPLSILFQKWYFFEKKILLRLIL